jgi:hypothetical protein
MVQKLTETSWGIKNTENTNSQVTRRNFTNVQKLFMYLLLEMIIVLCKTINKFQKYLHHK